MKKKKIKVIQLTFTAESQLQQQLCLPAPVIQTSTYATIKVCSHTFFSYKYDGKSCYYQNRGTKLCRHLHLHHLCPPPHSSQLVNGNLTEYAQSWILVSAFRKLYQGQPFCQLTRVQREQQVFMGISCLPRAGDTDTHSPEQGYPEPSNSILRLDHFTGIFNMQSSLQPKTPNRCYSNSISFQFEYKADFCKN